ncbi:unnamed protein product [Rotaria sp. Silwood1]|nr:unnamed protein product [Rotaria sp. Silwood1]CAF1395088.1 unnamed protein product [Rotaria sp. Silwood1]
MSNPSNEVKISPSSKTIVLAARSRLIRAIRELNLFSDHPIWSSTLTLTEQILITRLFLILTSISLLIVIGYASLTVRTYEITLNKFSISDFERLEARYPNTIKVPCTQVSIPYNKFLNLSPKFHQVCSSPFIRKKWISSLYLFNATSHNILDFRTFAFSQYRSLRLLCLLARQAINDTYRTFNSSHFINRYAFSRVQFNEMVSVLADNHQRNILTNEKQTVRILSMITAQNRLLSALRTNYYIQSVPGSKTYFTYNAVYLEQNGTEKSSCDCRLRGNQCTYPAGAFYNWTLPELGEAAKNNPPPLFQIPGLMAGCIPLDSMRQSTLECLYNQSCVDAISLQPKISRPKALNASLSRFPLNSTIASLFDESLFVEYWQNQSSFENYFAACAPRSIFYSYERRFHLGKTITMSLSAFGGLVIIWQLITPAIVKIWQRIKWKKQPNQPTTDPEQSSVDLEVLNMTPNPINKVITSNVHRTIRNFNLFPPNKKNDPEEERIGIIATRLYIVLTLIGLTVLGFYTFLSTRSQTHTEKSPSLSKFEELYSIQSSKLSCPCSSLSMSYGRIMSLSPRYHSICSSDYLEDYWLSYFGRIEIDVESIQILSTDFRLSGQSFFDLLRVLCEISRETVENALRVFRSNRLVTMNSLSRSQFTYETMRRLKQFEQQTIASFLGVIELIRSSIQTNQLMDETWTNVGPFTVYNNETSKWSLNFRSRDFYTNSCSCAVSNQCTRPVGFYFQTDNIRSKPKITVPGLVLGCYAIDSLLLSTLECFYEQECVKLLIANYDFDIVGLVRPLNSRAIQIQPLRNENSRFYSNTTINEIFSQLFVEDWINSSNFTSYYTRCAPSKCTYTIRKRFNISYMLAIMLGFYGGLSTILEIILPPLVKSYLQQWSKRKKKIRLDNPTNLTIDTTINTPYSSSKETHHGFRKMSQRLLSLNLFVSEPPSIEKRFQNQEITATRIYIFLFILCLITALIYSGPFSEETKSIKITFPTMDIVDNLDKKNISRLSCPCSEVAVPYWKFLSIKPAYHSICSSEYISSSYRINLLKKNDSMSLALSTHYRILSSLCYSSHRLIENAKEVFDTRELISVETLTRSSFDIQINILLTTFISHISAYYRRTLSFIVHSFSVNQLLNLFESNWQVDLTNENETYILKTFPRLFSLSNCSCAISSNCSEQLIGDIVTGCFPYYGLRLSKFENFSLGKLNDQLFVEIWTNHSNYTKYFEACRPLECQYTVSDKNNPLFMLANLLGLYGGLTYSLRLIVGQSLLAYRWRIKRVTTKTDANEIS